jgi:hypothetical protein
MAAGRLAALAVGVVGAAMLACGGGGSSLHALDASDHAVLVEASEVQALFPSVQVDPAREVYSKQIALGSWELEYTYETDEVTVSSMAFVEDTAEDASWVMWGVGMAPAFLGDEVAFREDASLVTRGDEKQCGLLVEKSIGLPGGNLCTVREGGFVAVVVLAGVYVDQAGGLDPLLDPVLTAAKGYTPKENPLPSN